MKKLSFILAIIMVASLFVAVAPVNTVAASSDYECLVNGVPYETLYDAVLMGVIDEATEDTTITLLKDVTVTGVIQFASKYTNADGTPIAFTVDLNGYKMTANANNVFQLGVKNNNDINAKEHILTFKNGYIEHDGPGSVFQLFSYGECNLENLIINCTNKVNYCVLNTMTGSNKDGKKLVFNVKNVEIVMPSRCNTNQTSFFRSGNPATDRTDDPSVEAYFENCNFNTVGDVPAENPVRALWFRSAVATVTMKNCTFSSPKTPVYCDDEIKSMNTANGVVTPTVILIDCKYTVLDSNSPAMNNPDCVKIEDDPLVEDGFQGFDLPTPPETEYVPETTETPETEPAPETDPIDTPAATEPTDTPAATDPAEDTPAATTPTDTPAVTTPAVTEPANTDKPAGGGCGGFTAVATFIALICGAGAAIVIKKK